MIGPVTFCMTTMGALFAGLVLGFIMGLADGAKINQPDIYITPPGEENHYDIDDLLERRQSLN